MATQRGRPRDEVARRRVVDVATTLFVRDGYLSTTMSDIAAAAGVAVKTVYAAYGSKLGVLTAAHDRAVAGDDAPTPLLDRPWLLALKDAGSPRAAWADAAPRLTASTARAAPIIGVLQSAGADPGVADVLEDLRRQRHTFSLALARILLELPGAAPGGDAHRVADVYYATVSAETYRLLVVERGWSDEAWSRWAHDTVERELTEDARG